MCENVNINVSETNETINIVATEVQEVIDINVFETAEDVTLNITEQLIQVNVNKVTSAAVTNTSELINDGEDGVHPFITAEDLPSLTGFVPYTGATEDVNLGEFGLLTGNIEFDNTPTNIPTTEGAMYWNDADGTADLILKGGNVKLQIGQESVIRVVNKTATNINLLEANYQAVRVTGAQGQRLKVDLAQATTDNLSAETIGLVTETINNNQEGFITTSGLVRNINTTGSLQGETWADGDILYLSATTAGNVTKVKPTAPNHLVIIGYVVHAHANQGSIFVKVDNGYELDELHNVKITSAANNNVLAYNSATDIWENKTVETALGYTPENVANKSTSTSLGTSDTLYPTQNAVKVYADTKFTLPSLTSGSVLFSDGTTIAQDNSNLFWDNTNNRLGIGTATPDSRFYIAAQGALSTDLVFKIRNSANTADILKVNGLGIMEMTNVSTSLQLLNTTGVGVQFQNGAGSTSYSIRGWNVNSGAYTPLNINASTLNLNTLSNTNVIFGGGNVLINTTTDAGFKLDVNGTARVSGTTTITPAALTGTAATSALDIAQTWNTTGNPTALKLNVINTASGANSLLLDLQVGGASQFRLTKAGSGIFAGGISSSSTITSLVGYRFTSLNHSILGGSNGLIDTTPATFSPTSGTSGFTLLLLGTTINQTGGANGITRGLYINPTLTAAADFRAIEVANGITILGASTTEKASLRIPSGTAPTTPTNGDIWFDGTDLKMRIGGVTKTFTLT